MPAPRRRPRVALTSRIFAPEPAAASFRLAALVRALVRIGADVDVLTVSVPGGIEDSPRPGVRILRRPVLRDRTGYVRGYVQYLSFDVPLLARLLLLRRPDVVVVEPPPTTGAAVRVIGALRRLPYVYYAADVWSAAAVSTDAPSCVVAALRLVESWVLRGAAAVVAVSPEVAEQVRGLGASRVTVVRGGIDTEVFRPDGPVPSTAPSGPYVVYAGTVSEWQGAEVFVRAMDRVAREVPGAHLVILGQGSGWSDLVAAASELPDGGACVTLIPAVPAAEAAAWQRGATVAVVSLRPGIGYDFAVPTKILAGAACGTPVLFAGPSGPAAQLVREAGIGRAVDHDVGVVARTLSEMLGTVATEEDRRRIAAWVAENASARSAGDAAAGTVRGVVRRRRRRRRP